MCNVGLYNVVLVNIKEVKWSKLSGFRYVWFCVCVWMCMLCNVDCLVRIMWLGDRGCYAPKAIIECWNPRAPKICIERMVLPHWWLVWRKGMLKPHVEMHGSCTDCNQVIRKLLMSRSQLLDTLGRKYRVAIR